MSNRVHGRHEQPIPRLCGHSVSVLAQRGAERLSPVIEERHHSATSCQGDDPDTTFHRNLHALPSVVRSPCLIWDEDPAKRNRLAVVKRGHQVEVLHVCGEYTVGQGNTPFFP